MKYTKTMLYLIFIFFSFSISIIRDVLEGTTWYYYVFDGMLIGFGLSLCLSIYILYKMEGK
ncbi:hypothetical protein LH61_05430 [Leuconostoc mesenteroides P45]|nr:hypothetical protein LH61_05430 [Leuconostoc mesenteroides P45]